MRSSLRICSRRNDPCRAHVLVVIGALARIALTVIGGVMLVWAVGLPLLLFFGFIGLLVMLAGNKDP